MDLYRCLRTFKDVVDLNSFAQAARKRYRPASQLSKEIAWLEAELNCQLLIRTTRKLSLTEEGERCYQYAVKALTDFQDIKASLQNNDDVSGELRISVPVAFGESIIANMITPFMLQYPKIKMDVCFENNFVDLIDHNIDIALRTEQKNQQIYHYQFFMSSQRMIYVAPSCIEQYGEITKPSDLENYPCLLHSQMIPPGRWNFKNGESVNVQERYRCNNVTSLVKAAAAGLGCIYMSSHQVQLVSYLHNGDLKPVLTEYVPNATKLYFCTVKQMYVPKKITAFIEFAQHYLSD